MFSYVLILFQDLQAIAEMRSLRAEIARMRAEMQEASVERNIIRLALEEYTRRKSESLRRMPSRPDSARLLADIEVDNAEMATIERGLEEYSRRMVENQRRRRELFEEIQRKVDRLSQL